MNWPLSSFCIHQQLMNVLYSKSFGSDQWRIMHERLYLLLSRSTEPVERSTQITTMFWSLELDQGELRIERKLKVVGSFLFFFLINLYSLLWSCINLFFSDGTWMLRGPGLLLTSELLNGQARIWIKICQSQCYTGYKTLLLFIEKEGKIKNDAPKTVRDTLPAEIQGLLL